MKIEFESRSEIQRMATVLQNTIYPDSIIIDIEDILDACGNSDDRPIPWNMDGFHPFIEITDDTPEMHHPEITKNADKTNESDKIENSGQLFSYLEVFGRGQVWEEVIQDGKKYLRRVVSGDTPFTSEENLIYLAGQLDSFFQLIRSDQYTYKEVSDLTGQTEEHLVDLCRIWSRRTAGHRKELRYD